MLITENTISNVREASVTQVVGHFIKLNNRGKARCPFHDEKSASLSVTEAKGIYKCFGCGAGGDAISFVQKHEKQDFFEAIKTIAEICGIPIDYQEVGDPKKYEEQKAAKDQLKEVVSFAVEKYKNNLWTLPDTDPVMVYLQQRNITREIIAEWQLGWATEEWNNISPTLITKGWYEHGTKLGLIKRSKDERNYDGYRSRLIIPITNRHGEYIGIAGRYLPIDPSDQGKTFAKYINPPENELYNKSSILYGLSQGDKKINSEGYAYLVEGYFDVITMHTNEVENTIATCGTALTIQQTQLLRKYTGHVVVFRDSDKAGRAAAVKDLHILTKAGFKVEVALLPDGDDPDEYYRKKVNDLYKDHTIDIQDGILWQVENMIREVMDDHYKSGQAKQDVLQLLILIPNDIIRDNYFDNIIKKYKWNRPVMQKQLSVLLDQRMEADDKGEGELEETIKFAEWMSEEQKEEVMRSGYLQVNRKEKGKPMVGYYSFSQNGKTEITNFTITPLFRIEAGQDTRYLSAIDNGYVKSVVDMPAKIFPSIEQFQGMCIAAGGSFFIYGSRNQWLRISTDLLHKYPSCQEVNSLGWNKKGDFFAFVDVVYKAGPGLIKLDEWGVVKFDDKNFLIAAGSEAYKKLAQWGNDPYENLRFLSYTKTEISFERWAQQMYRVYDNKGLIAIGYTILTLMRDVVFDVDNNCPHLYGFGEPSSGKSKWAESITKVFFKSRQALNLNSGTINAFFTYMSLFANCPAHLNEFDIETMQMERFQAIKSSFDGEGRERGKLGVKNSTEIQKVVSTLILTGQKLVTVDDNSVVTRCIIEPFSTVDDRSQEDKDAYDLLKDWERAGLNSMITEILAHRKLFEEKYKDNFNALLSHWRRTKKTAQNLNQRILQNYGHLFTCYKMISNFITLPVSGEDFSEYCFGQVVKWSGFIRSSDTLSEFWRTLEFLYNQQQILDGWDFIVQEVTEVSIRVNREDSERRPFEKPTKVLFLRLNNAHKLFQSTYKLRSGKEAMSLENLLHYFSSRKYYVGTVKQKKFKRYVNVTDRATKPYGQGSMEVIETTKQEEFQVTSCHAFLYEDLEIDIGKNIELPELPFGNT